MNSGRSRIRPCSRSTTHTPLIAWLSLNQQLGWAEKAHGYAIQSEQIKAAVKMHCWDSTRQLFRDYPDKAIYSQHTNIMAILCDVLAHNEQPRLLKNILQAESLDEYASAYFSFLI